MVPEEELFAHMQRDLTSLIEGFEGHALVQELVLGFYGVVLDRSRQELLFRAVHITAVSAFEVHISGLVAEWFRRYPRMLASGDRDVSTDELLDAPSIPAIIDALIERRAEQVMRGGYSNWAQWLEPKLKVTFDELAMDPVATRELFARRHLYVHSGGSVTRRYRASTGTEVGTGVELPLDERYVFATLDRLVVLGLSLAVAARKQLAPGLPRFGVDMSSRTVEHLMRASRWEAVLRASEIQERLNESPDDRLGAKVNVWLAKKHLLGVGAIRRQVQSWNVRDLAPIYRLAQHALLNQDDDALTLAAALVDQKVVDATIVDWPVFANLRRELTDLFRSREPPAS
jgi:hypothetical protein